MRRIWEMSTAERADRQTGKVREMLIGAWAPREPEMMELVLKMLEYEKKYPISMVHKLIDRLASMAVSTIVVTPEEIMDFINGIPGDFAIAKGPCACRINTAEHCGPDARDISGGRLDFCKQTPLNVDIQIAKCGEVFGQLDNYKRITKEELLALEKDCLNMGLVPNIYIIMGGEGSICHCSSRTCAPLLANEAIGGKSKFLKKGLNIPRTDKNLCKGAGSCVKVCHFGARKMDTKSENSQPVFDPSKCYGCGLCAYTCKERAIEMIPRRIRDLTSHI